MKLLDGKQLNIQQISSALDIPLSSTYRKIGRLEYLHIIKKTKIIRRLDGLDESLYTLWIYEINMTYKNSNFSYEIKHKSLEGMELSGFGKNSTLEE